MSEQHHYYRVTVDEINNILLRNAGSELTRMRYNSQFLWNSPNFPTQDFIDDLDELQYHHEKIQRRLAKPQPWTSFIMKRVSKYELLKIIKAINSLHKEAEDFRRIPELYLRIPEWVDRTSNWNPVFYYAG